jgi:hypothetical protein
MPRITISYRRNDSGVITGRIFDRLALRYGRDAVFRDIDNIPPGVDFREHINHVLNETEVLLAIIGPAWLGSRAGQNRLNDEADAIRAEIEISLRKQLPLIPVLVLGAGMPSVSELPASIQDFAYRNAVRVDSDQDFDVHMARLTRALDTLLQGAGGRLTTHSDADSTSSSRIKATWHSRTRLGILALSVLSIVAFAGLYTSDYWAWKTDQFELLFWQTATQTGSTEDFKAYIREYPQGHFASLAQNRLTNIKATQTPSAPEPEPITRKPVPALSTIGPTPKPLRSPDLSGTVSAIANAARIRVDGRWIELYGISDPTSNDSSHVAAIIRYLSPTKGMVECYQKIEGKYQCYAGEEDLALKAIQAGFARAAPDAPAAYR